MIDLKFDFCFPTFFLFRCLHFYRLVQLVPMSLSNVFHWSKIPQEDFSLIPKSSLNLPKSFHRVHLSKVIFLPQDHLNQPMAFRHHSFQKFD